MTSPRKKRTKNKKNKKKKRLAKEKKSNSHTLYKYKSDGQQNTSDIDEITSTPSISQCLSTPMLSNINRKTNAIEMEVKRDFDDAFPINFALLNSENIAKETQISNEYFATQCPNTINKGGDASLIKLCSIGRLNNFPLLQSYIMNSYKRFLIDQKVQNMADVGTEEFFNIPFYEKMEFDSNNLIKTFITDYGNRILPALQFDPNTLIVDDMEDIMTYVIVIARLIHHFIEQTFKPPSHTMQSNKYIIDAIPFQLDLMIIPKDTELKEELFASNESVYSGGEPDEPALDITPSVSLQTKRSISIKDIGNIEHHLNNHNIKYEQHSFTPGPPTIVNIRRLEEIFKDTFQNTLRRFERHGRYVIAVDRNRESEEDLIFMYRPNISQQNDDMDGKLGSDFGSLAPDPSPESCLFKTAKCLIPSCNDDNKNGDEDDGHIGARDLPHGVITLSFHVLSQELIKCYFFINGCGSVFKIEDIFDVWPMYFQPESQKTKNTIPNVEKLKEMFKLPLMDKGFDTWYSNTVVRGI